MVSINSSSASSSSQSLLLQDNIHSTDSKIETIRNKVLTAIRSHAPIQPFFRPELKINLNTFVKVRRITK